MNFPAHRRDQPDALEHTPASLALWPPPSSRKRVPSSKSGSDAFDDRLDTWAGGIGRFYAFSGTRSALRCCPAHVALHEFQTGFSARSLALRWGAACTAVPGFRGARRDRVRRGRHSVRQLYARLTAAVQRVVSLSSDMSGPNRRGEVSRWVVVSHVLIGSSCSSPLRASGTSELPCRWTRCLK